MNRDEKNKQTKQKILDSALEEFANKSYAEASLNTICATGNISKGIIYHYFKDKDELYLSCLSLCFEGLTQYLKTIQIEDLTIEEALTKYFDARYSFFEKYPLFLHIFCNAIMHPPLHLSEQMRAIMMPFRTQNMNILTTLLSRLKLNQEVTIEEIVETFQEYHDFVNAKLKSNGAISLEDHERKCHNTLKIMLYGVIERKE